ncbi:hypothetical protein DRN86_03000 [Candidatus Geothermarchaeota archaeon]|nr:MAG: hypothetical protein DRN86_03000 [Candidatus Geothermarchaeota archaeon]
MRTSIESLIKRGRVKRALVIGVGGGGDVLSTLPTYRYLRSLGLNDVLLGGVAWERVVVDPKPGPRSLDEITGVKKISETVGLIGKESRTIDGVVLQAARLSGFLRRRMVVIDLNKGVRGVVRGLSEAVEKLGIDLVIGVDGGGDILAKGDEKGLSSPLADSIMLAALAQINVPSVIGVFGFGSDGELRQEELLRRLSEVASIGGYLGAIGLSPDDVELLRRASKHVFSEASFLPVLAANGKIGEVSIREGTRRVFLSMFSTITFYLDAKKLFSISPLARAIRDTRSIFEANKILNKMGLFTELDFEYLASKLGSTSYREIVKYLKTKGLKHR